MPKHFIKNSRSSILLLRQMRSSFLRLFPTLFPPDPLYTQWYNFIETSQWWSEAEIKKYQWEKLKALIEYCYQNIPFYKCLFEGLNMKPEDIHSWDDYNKIPFTTKDMVRADAAQFLSVSANKDLFECHTTSGSTGEPLSLFKTASLGVIENAFMFNQWARVGYRFKDLIARIRGEELPDGNLWYYDHASNAFVFLLL